MKAENQGKVRIERHPHRDAVWRLREAYGKVHRSHKQQAATKGKNEEGGRVSCQD